MSAATADTIEDIPDGDEVSRAYFGMPEELDPGSQFPFRRDHRLDERAESVFWRRYAPAIAEIHERGCRIEQIKKTRNQLSPKYIGSRTAIVAKIRHIQSGRGHKFIVLHFPENGDKAHAHICISPASGVALKKLSPNDIRELVDLLIQTFGPLEPHNC